MISKYAAISMGLILLSTSAAANSKEDIRALVEQCYAGAQIGDIEQGSRNGKRVYEIDFEFEGDEYEALIFEEGRFIDIYLDRED